MRKINLSTILALMAIFLLVLPAAAQGNVFPDLIPLPTGFQPEGIAGGLGSTFFTGSVANGAVIRGDFRTGESSVLVPGQDGMQSTGMKYDARSNALFVSGAATGLARVFDADTGELLASYQLATAGSSFINDVVITRDAAYFTNSFDAVLYKLPLGPGGSLPDPGQVVTLPLTGEWDQVTAPGAFNANGIEATPDGKWLIVVNSTTGKLYRVNPDTGEAAVIDLGGQSVSAGDGLLFRGSLLYVVRNQLNEIVVVDLYPGLTAGRVVDTITNSAFNVPTTIASFGDALYAVNAKFGTPNPATIPFEIVRVPLH